MGSSTGVLVTLASRLLISLAALLRILATSVMLALSWVFSSLSSCAFVAMILDEEGQGGGDLVVGGPLPTVRGGCSAHGLLTCLLFGAFQYLGGIPQDLGHVQCGEGPIVLPVDLGGPASCCQEFYSPLPRRFGVLVECHWWPAGGLLAARWRPAGGLAVVC